jgi:hypothetical protein
LMKVSICVLLRAHANLRRPGARWGRSIVSMLGRIYRSLDL